MYTEDWLKNVPVGTQLIFGDEPCDIYTVSEKKYRLHTKTQRYLNMPLSQDKVRLYYDSKEKQCRIAYQEPTHDFPLIGRLKGIIYPEES